MDEKAKVSGYLAVSKDDEAQYYASDAYLSQNANLIKSAFKGEVTDKEIKFPKALGAEHPFDFNLVEGVYKQIGIINGAVNAYTDAIMGDFTVVVDNNNAQALLDDFR